MNKNDMVFDINFALRQAGGDKQVLNEVITILMEEIPKRLKQIKEAIEKNDAATVNISAHTIKGAVSNFKAESVCEAAFRLEKIGESEDLSQAESVFEVLKTEWERLEKELKKKL
jgi:HPt (histidine-containing phosphotransfer) domain-containing protein